MIQTPLKIQDCYIVCLVLGIFQNRLRLGTEYALGHFGVFSYFSVTVLALPSKIILKDEKS